MVQGMNSSPRKSAKRAFCFMVFRDYSGFSGGCSELKIWRICFHWNFYPLVSGSGSNGTVIMADDTWHHRAVVLNPTIGTTVGDLQFSIDGALDTLSFVGGTPINSSPANNVRIGASQGIANRSLTEKMDDIRMSTRALSAIEISDLVAPLDIPLVIADMERQENGSVALSWSGSPGEYSLEYTTDLSNPNWFELSDNEVIEAGETTGTSTDSSVATNPANTKIFCRFRKID